MSLRFRKSIRLFPGVRLNFSGGGISTTVGVRGASMTVGSRGTFLNAGLPGTGISYRTKVSSSTREHVAPTPSQRPPSTASAYQAEALPQGVVEIKSGEVSSLTSAGLDALKALINEATVKRRELTTTVATDRDNLATSERRLRFAQRFIIRIFTTNAIPTLVEKTGIARDSLEKGLAELEGCVVEVDFVLDAATLGSYAALVRAFDGLSRAQRTWDVETVQATDRVRERTVATTTLTRRPVNFDLVASEIVKTRHHVMRMPNSSGRNIYLYPGFLMMRDGGGDFALIEYAEVSPSFSQSRFVEEDQVPSDTQVVGHTWKKANKDGSPDKRFNGNYQIPIVRYAEIIFRSPSGLLEAYQFSNFDSASTFQQAFTAHVRTLAELLKKPSVEFAGSPPGVDDMEEPTPPESVTATNVASPNLVLDWATLIILVLIIVAGSAWGWSQRAEITRRFTPPIASPAPINPPVPAAATPPLHHLHGRPHRRPTTATAKSIPATDAAVSPPT